MLHTLQERQLPGIKAALVTEGWRPEPALHVALGAVLLSPPITEDLKPRQEGVPATRTALNFPAPALGGSAFSSGLSETQGPEGWSQDWGEPESLEGGE